MGGPGSIVALDGVCYTIVNGIPGTDDDTPASQVSYADCPTCVANSATEDCLYTFEACAVSVLGQSVAEGLMVNPYKLNTTDNAIYSGTQYRKWGFTKTSSNSTFEVQDCYNWVTYDSSVTYMVTDSGDSASDCTQAGKCDATYTRLQSCGTPSKIFIGQLSYATLTGNNITTGDTLYAPALYGTTIANPTSQIASVLGQTTGSCYTVLGGYATTVPNVPQGTAASGTDWSLSTKQFSVQSSCNDVDCGCKTNFIITNTGGAGTTFQCKKCDGTLYTVGPLPNGGTQTVSDCINMNSFWQLALGAGHYNNVEISGSYDNC